MRHAFLGVQLLDSLEEQTDGARIPVGASIEGFVGDDSAARGAGLEIGDLIVRFDGQTVRTSDDVIIGIRQYRVGQTIELELLRDGERFMTEIQLGERPPDP